MNNEVKSIAKNVMTKAGIPEEEEFGSIIAILMVISIILTVIRVLQECNKNKTENMTAKDKVSIYGESIRTYSKKRGWFTRLRIKRIIKRNINSEQYKKYGIKLTESLMDVGESLTDDQVYSLLEASNV
jgi:hypothetical protein